MSKNLRWQALDNVVYPYRRYAITQSVLYIIIKKFVFSLHNCNNIFVTIVDNIKIRVITDVQVKNKTILLLYKFS